MATCLPHIFSNAKLISPTVALFLAASIANSSRLPLPVFAHTVNARSDASILPLSLDALTLLILSIYFLRTVVLLISSVSNGSSLSNLYLFTPTITSEPASILAYLLAADSSIRAFGIPDMIAYVIPPISSTSLIIFSASSSNSFVKVSII